MRDSTGSLKKHLTTEHKAEKIFQCPLRSCRMLIADLTRTLGHLKEHEGKLVYQCPHCEKQYLSLKDVGVHQHSHVVNGEKKASRLYNRSVLQRPMSSPGPHKSAKDILTIPYFERREKTLEAKTNEKKRHPFCVIFISVEIFSYTVKSSLLDSPL